MRKTNTILAALSISTALLIGAGGDDTAARGLVRYCSQAHADQVNSLTDDFRYAQRSQIMLTAKNCNWIVYEDFSVRLK